MVARLVNKVQDGKIINIVTAADVKGGDVYPFGVRTGIIVNDAASGELVGLELEGVFRIPVVEGDTVALGDVLYWDMTNKVATTDSNTGANLQVGYACTEKAAGVSGTCDVKLG